MWMYILEAIIIGDLLINFFFHIIQLRRYIEANNAVRRLADRFGGLESKVSDIELSTRMLKDMSQSASGRQSGSDEGQKTD